MFSKAFIAAVVAFLPLIDAHVVMTNPTPFNAATVDVAPLLADGSNFPCKVVGSYSSPATIRTYTPGIADTFILNGTAVHGGGSCQISITYDNPPTANSVFKVVQSFEGACPISAVGNLPESSDQSVPHPALPALPITFPEGLKSGGAVFVWTWFNKIGNREMYMNCAPITIGGTETSDTLFKSLPDMFVANINVPQSQCTTKETFDIVFPEPGSNVIIAPASDGVNFSPACGTGSVVPSAGPVQSPTSAAMSSVAASSTFSPPNVSTQPALVGTTAQTAPAVGTVFTPINGPSATPTSQMTTFVTLTSSVVVVPTSTSVMVSAPVLTSTSMMSATSPVAMPSPTGGSSSSSGSCKAGMVCSTAANMSNMYAICYADGTMSEFREGPPGTWCDPSINNWRIIGTSGSAKTRRAQRLARQHIKRTHGHARS